MSERGSRQWAMLALASLACSVWVAFHERAIDLQVSHWVYGLHAPPLGVAMQVASALGAVPMLAVVVGALAFSHVRRGERRQALRVVLLALLAQALNVALKLVFQLPRPDLLEGVVRPETYGFPSGHAMVSTVVFGVTAGSLAQRNPGRRAAIQWGAAALVATICLSRVYLGMHWPSDVLGGVAIGGLLLLFRRPLR